MSNRRVLIIDDDSDFQAIASWLLQKQGYETQSMTDPREVERWRGGDPQVILLDWQLGDLDGTELIQHLRRRFPHTSVVFVTGFSSPEIAATSIKLGALDFLTKPLDEGKLIVSMAKAVEHAPRGGCVAWGIPFEIGPAVVIGTGTVRMPVGSLRAGWLVFMHTSDERPLELNASGFASPMPGAGRLNEHAADYVIEYEDGSAASLV